MGPRYSAPDVLSSAVHVSLEGGLSALTFGRVAEHLGSSDRMVVYYFPTKTDLVAAVVAELGTELQQLLGVAFGDEPATPDQLVKAAWPVLSSKRGDRIFAVFFEMIGLASSGLEPYASLTTSFMHSWADWLADRVKGSRPAVRRQRALGVMARVDGLLMLRRVMGPAAAEAAARELLRDG